jgi:hypothetical protein
MSAITNHVHSPSVLFPHRLLPAHVSSLPKCLREGHGELPDVWLSPLFSSATSLPTPIVSALVPALLRCLQRSLVAAAQCPGSADIECCPEPTPNCSGQCQDNSLHCSGHYESGKCPGPSNVQWYAPPLTSSLRSHPIDGDRTFLNLDVRLFAQLRGWRGDRLPRLRRRAVELCHPVVQNAR